MVYNADQYVQRALNDTTNDPGMCLQQTRIWAGIDAKYGTAAEAWAHTKKRITGNPPKGSTVWWTGGSHGAGHVAVSLGNGKIRSTDAGGTGRVATVDLHWPEQHWGLHWAGASWDLDDVTVPHSTDTPILHGLDISHYQSGINLTSTGLDFVIAKATQGHHTDDTTWRGFINQAKAAGMLYGVYHFAENDGDLTGEADHFIDEVSSEVGKALLVLDWEKGNLGNVSGAKAFLDRVFKRTGIRPLIYMSQSVASGHNWTSVAQDYALWVARYNDEIGPTGAWNTVAMWQYTSSGHEGGYTVDLDRFYGSRDTWRAFASGDNIHDNGGDMSDARMVWNEDLTLWTPKDGTAKDPMPAGQQLNQARGFAEDTFENTKQVKKALRALAKDPVLTDNTKTQMLDVLADD